MIVTATEFKTNFGKYLDLVSQEDVLLTKNGKIVAQVIKPEDDRNKILESLVGFAKTDKEVNLNDIREERLARQWDF